MLLKCPHCNTAQTEGISACTHCGGSLPSSATDLPAAPHRRPASRSSALLNFAHPAVAAFEKPALSSAPARRASWKIPALLAGLMLTFAVGTYLYRRSHPAPASLFAATPTGAHSAHAPKREGVVPMKIALVASRSGHVPVGSAVTITAFTTLPQGKSAHMALSYQRRSGPRVLFSFALGSLCSAIWTPLVPGRYTLTASALNENRQAAISQNLTITVERPRAKSPSPTAADSPIQMADAIPQRTETPPRVRKPLHRKHRPVVVRPAPAVPVPAPPVYHVVAARFPFPQNADVFAQSLQNRGVPAVVRRMRGKGGKMGYVVETGAYLREAEAQKQSVAWQRSGYPAYYFSKP